MYESCYCHNNFLSFKYKQVMVFWIVMPSKKFDILLNIDCHNTISIHPITVYIEILDIFIATYHNKKKCASGRGITAKCCSLAPPKKAQLRAPLSPLQTAWIGFDPNLYSGGLYSYSKQSTDIHSYCAACY